MRPTHRGSAAKMPPQKPPKIVSLPRKMGWWILCPSTQRLIRRPIKRIPGHFWPEGTSNRTCAFWCEEPISGVRIRTPENPLEATGADGKTYPSERLNAARRQLSKDEIKDLVIRLRKEHRLSYRQIEEATGVSEKTCRGWCQENDQFSGAENAAPENSVKVQGADKKEYPAERLSPEDLAERRRLVRELRNAGYTLEEIAEELGISIGTVHADLQAGAVVLTTAAKDHRVAKALETGVVLDRPVASDTDLLRAARQRERELHRLQDQERVSGSAETLAELIEAGKRFATIVLDPPWDWDDEEDHEQFGRGRPTYAMLPYEKLLDLPVGQLAEDNAHLYLWITCRSLPKGFGLLREWGFRYITTLTWCKPSFGMGNYFRGSTEHVLFGVRGNLPLRRHDVGTWFQAARGPDGHSSKPQEFFDLVESCSPGPYLEMFARRERPGWTTWGPPDGEGI